MKTFKAETKWFAEAAQIQVPDGARVVGIEPRAQRDETGELKYGREVTWIIEVPNE